MNESQPSNIIINSGGGSNKGGGFLDNILDNVFKWGILLLGIVIIVIIGVALYLLFFTQIGEKIIDLFDAGTNALANPTGFLWEATIGGFLGWLTAPLKPIEVSENATPPRRSRWRTPIGRIDFWADDFGEGDKPNSGGGGGF